ncbi:MAG: VUT family protein [Pseudomonadota bacterium]
MSRLFVFGVLAMAIVVTTSNILVQFTFGTWLTWGAFTYPFAFLITDLCNRLGGAALARRVVLVGFGVGVICSLIGSQLEGPYGPYVTLRIALGSGIAFLLAQLLDVALFQRLRDRAWWTAPAVSSIFGGALDTFLFFAIAFSASLAFIDPSADIAWAQDRLPILGLGPEAPLWASLAVADFAVKLALAALALIPFRLIVQHFRAQPQSVL